MKASDIDVVANLLEQHRNLLLNRDHLNLAFEAPETEAGLRLWQSGFNFDKTLEAIGPLEAHALIRELARLNELAVGLVIDKLAKKGVTLE